MHLDLKLCWDTPLNIPCHFKMLQTQSWGTQSNIIFKSTGILYVIKHWGRWFKWVSCWVMVEIKCDPHIIFYSTELQLIPLFCLKQHRKILFYQQKKLKKQSITLITSVVQAIFYFSYTLFLLAPYFKNSGTLTNSFLHFLRLYSFIASPVLCFCIKSFPSYCDLYDDIYL